jgi:hypothetical protein
MEGGAAVKPGPVISGGDHGWNGVGALGANVRTVGLTRGPHAVLIFPFYPKLAQHANQKRMSYLAQKIPKFCMLLDRGILNNFLNCASIQFSIDVELKLLEQIHNLNF